MYTYTLVSYLSEKDLFDILMKYLWSSLSKCARQKCENQHPCGTPTLMSLSNPRVGILLPNDQYLRRKIEKACRAFDVLDIHSTLGKKFSVAFGAPW